MAGTWTLNTDRPNCQSGNLSRMRSQFPICQQIAVVSQCAGPSGHKRVAFHRNLDI